MSTPEYSASAKSRFDITNLTTDPFVVATWSVAMISWVIAFIGSIVANIEGSFPRFTWWGLVFQLLMLVFLPAVYCFDVVEWYRLFLTCGYSIAFIYTTNSATNLVWSGGSATGAASAGVILLSMVNLIWVFYYGSDNASPINQWIDSFSLRGPKRSSVSPFHSSRPISPDKYSSSENDEFKHSSWNNQRYMSSTALNGLENVSQGDTLETTPFNSPDHDGLGTNITAGGTNITIDEFPYTARALYNYQKSPDDENEISFEKDEILKVNDIHSRWWQAKRANGEIGICPSNYVELIE
ncbi:osmosensor SHO1 CYBJADRAFT_166167 [Cyberlindnera jadinii NRRL Y-1542]|uniref:High osmolarity signaling protein SHO1 n=1 Tax=Cyberlindnera jadinii (strain ATCC 18201 / CBS 1600 / BCRC 20928 / JCM 3617 / NBRC 0987 / NRRL Y-1542) TaxID=983966 RepID=A0A1E4S7D4_CYBJN|nr:membrane protein [Cyberlindnera jadinii NRRL Y-1542]ODV75437.1 membrane protein [Cyberlindnera jadinii NRRL Y-1542]